MRVLLFTFKIIITGICVAAYIYNYLKSDGSLEFYLQFSLLLNFFLVLLFSISTREDPALNRSFYRTLAISRRDIVLGRIKILLSNPFYLIIFVCSLSIFFDSRLTAEQKIIYTFLFNIQFIISLVVSFLVYDILQANAADKQFFLIPLILISITNILVQMKMSSAILALDFFGGFIFMPIILIKSFDVIVLSGLVVYVGLILLLNRMHGKIED